MADKDIQLRSGATDKDIKMSADASASLYPTISSTTGANNSTADTSHTINLPSVNEGDLLMVAFVCADQPVITWDNASHGTWTELTNVTTLDPSMVVYWKVADGTEFAGTLTITTSISKKSAYQTWAIYNWNGIAPLAPATVQFIDETLPDPPENTFGEAESLWMALLAVNNETTVNAYPTNYDDNQSSQVTTTFMAVGIHAATREFTGTSEDPGTFTMSAVGIQHAATIVILPVGAGLGISRRRYMLVT